MATTDRVYIDEEFRGLADRLVSRKIPGTESVQGVFHDSRELVVFAAGLGFRKDRFKKLKKNGREIKLSAIQRIDIGGQDIAGAIAVAHTNGVEILHPDRAQDLAEIFECYLNGGLEYIAGMTNDEQSGLEVIASLVKSEYAPEESKNDVIDLLSQRI